jgi:hypothetical protein
MSTSKNITILLGVGGVIAVGYYFLRKSKPNVADEQLSQLNTNTTSSIQQELAPKPTIEEQLFIDRCSGAKTRGEYEICKRNIQSGTTSATTSGTTTGTTSGTTTGTTATLGGTRPSTTTGTTVTSGGTRPSTFYSGTTTTSPTRGNTSPTGSTTTTSSGTRGTVTGTRG